MLMCAAVFHFTPRFRPVSSPLSSFAASWQQFTWQIGKWKSIEFNCPHTYCMQIKPCMIYCILSLSVLNTRDMTAWCIRIRRAHQNACTWFTLIPLRWVRSPAAVKQLFRSYRNVSNLPMQLCKLWLSLMTSNHCQLWICTLRRSTYLLSYRLGLCMHCWFIVIVTTDLICRSDSFPWSCSCIYSGDSFLKFCLH